jgi:tetratricopeptide (TPR) repeat protein
MRNLLLLSLAVCCATPALATPTKYGRTQDVAITTATPTHHTPPKPKAAPAGPTITSSQALEIAELVTVYQGQQEDILVELIRTTPDSEPDEKAEYLFMLGELHAKQARTWRLKSMETGSQADAKKAAIELKKTVETYAVLVNNDAYRKFPRMDTALFYLGYTLQSAGRGENARKIFDRLLSEYPKSKYIPEAHYTFAEYYFEAGQLADADARYRKVLQFPQSSLYWYAMYKLGWVHMNRKESQLALETFFQIVQGAKQDLLVKAATKDFVRAYADVGKADKALDAFRRVDKANALSMLETLADLYLDQGKSDRAIFVYRELMATAPKHAHVCAWQDSIVQATLSLKDAKTADKVEEVERLVKLAKAVKLPAAELQECRENAAATVDELARAYHSEAAKTRNVDTYGHAERLYHAYLDAFPGAKDQPQIAYFYAELLWARADGETEARKKTELFQKTGDAFTAVVTAGKVDAATLDIAAYGAVLAWKNANDVDPRPKLDLSTDDDKAYDVVLPELAIPVNEQKMLAAIDQYLARVKSASLDDRLGLTMLAGSTLRKYRHYSAAVPLFAGILDKHRDHDFAEDAAQLLLDTYNRMQKHDEMLALATKLATDQTFLAGKDHLKTTLAHLRRQGLRKAAEKIEKQARSGHDLAKYVACGDAFIEIYNADPMADDNDEVLWNALVCYHDGKSVGAALVPYEKLAKYYPKSKLYARATGRIGKAFGDVAFYEQAADKLEEYAKKYAGEEDAHGALSEAVQFRKGTGDDDKAIADTEYFVRTFGKQKPDEAADAMYGLTSIYEKRGDTDALVGHLRKYLGQFGAAGGRDRRVIAQAKIALALWHASCPVTEVDGSCVKITRERAVRGGAARLSTQCGPAFKTKLTVIDRDATRLRGALAAVAAARHEFEAAAGQGAKPSAEAKHFYAQVRFIEADKLLERYLAVSFPNNLDFDGAAAKKSLARFTGWLSDRTKEGTDAKKAYDAVLAVQDNATSIAASARVAQVAQHLSDALFTAEIPKSVRSGQFAADKSEEYCSRLTELAEPLATTATKAYGECLHQSTRLGWFSEWSQMCERELGQIKPDEFPTASELRGRIAGARTIVAEEPAPQL